MSSAKAQIAVAPNVPTLPAPQIQKEYSTEDTLNRQNSLGNNRRGNMKGKHLTRSLAMRESTSPPRTPTPRNDQQQLSSPNGQLTNNYSNSTQHHHHEPNEQSNSSNHSNNINNNNSNNGSGNKLHAQSAASTAASSPLLETPSVIVTSQHSQQQQQQQHPQKQNVAICSEADFPKLTPPKSSKSPRNNNHNNNNNNSNNANNNHNHRGDVNDKSNSAGGGGDKVEYNNISASSSNSSSSNGKKSVENNNKTHNSNNNNGNNKNQHQTYTSASGANAMQIALNVADPPSKHQQSTAASSNIYNSSMNYQLKTDATQQQQHCSSSNMYDKDLRCARNDSQNSSNSMSHDDHPHNVSDSHYERVGGGGSGAVALLNSGAGGGGPKKHRTTSNSKCTKPRLKTMGSSSSMDGGNSNSTSGFISRDSSMEQFTDQSGIDLLTFFKETLNKNPKDRNTLMEIEKDLIELAQDKTRSEIRFPAASSYNRMLIHRTAAFFGMEHNVDAKTQQCVIVATTKGTRIPEIRFKNLFRDRMSDEPRKSILKRDTHSFDDSRQGGYLCPDRGMLDRKAKSFEEREEDYEKARRRIFRNQQQQQQQQQQLENAECEENYLSWSSSVEQQQQQSRMRPSGKMLKVQTTTDSRDNRPVGVPKAQGNFGNYGVPPPAGGPPLPRNDSNKSGSGSRTYAKQDAMGSNVTSWRLSPSSSGYKTQTQSVHSDSVTPSPTGYGSDDLTPEPSVIACQSPPPTLPPASPLQTASDAGPASGGLVWAVTDISSVPKGSVLINPHTLQPIVNQDGSIYHFDPSNLPPSQAITPGMYSQGGAAASHNNYASGQQQQPAPQPATTKKSNKQQAQAVKNSQLEYGAPSASVAAATPSATATASTGAIAKCSVDSCAESSTQTVEEAATTSNVNESAESPREMLNIQEEGESNTANEADECDNTASNCLSVTTTTSTKSFDRIEIQKFKNQATSPNIPTSPTEADEPPVQADGAAGRDQAPRSQYQSQTPAAFVPQQRDTPNSARSTPYSTVDSTTKRANEEPKATPWTYTQSYQAPDGSTVFHTTNGSPYCTATTYQQGPDGSVYAIPQSMVYTYPSQLDGEVQGYFMPVYDPTHQRPEASGMLPAGSQALYPAAAGGATVVPVATAYPSTQFAAPAAAPIYSGQVLYSSDQFPGSGAAQVAGGAAVANGPSALQQYPVTTTYPIGYPYPYNGYWGQTMTTYYVPQQTLTNAAPLLPAPPTPASAVAGSHLTGGALNGAAAALTNNLMITTAAAGPPTSTLPSANGSGSYHHGSIYNGAHIAGRGKRTTPPHAHNGASATHAQINHHHHQTAAATGMTTTYQLSHAMPTFALATSANAAAAAAGELGGAGSAPAAAMYAIPQHAAAAMFPANILPYAAGAAQTAAGGVLAPVAAQHHVASHHSAATANAAAGAAAAAAAAHAHQANTVISPLFSHPPQQLFATQQPPPGTTHAPGPSAIAIVDPATVGHPAAGGGAQAAASSASGSGTYIGSNTPQSAPSTPHSLPAQPQQQQRNPPLFSTPPISAAAGGGVSYHYYAASHDSASYGGNANHSYIGSAYDKRNSGAAAGKKHSYTTNAGGGANSYAGRQSANSGYAGHNKSLLQSGNEPRSSPSAGSVGVSSNYQGNRPHAMHKRSNEKSSSSSSLLNGPPLTPYHSSAHNNNNNNNNSHSNATTEAQASKTATTARMISVGGGFRQKPNNFDFRRSGSQRNSPSTNSSNESNNNSPSSLVSTPPTAATYSASYVNSTGAEPQQQTSSSVYITRGQHIPPAMAPPPQMVGAPPPPGTHQAAAVLGGVAAEVANAAAAAAAVATGHQPLLGTYNPGAPTGVYFKYGQTYFTHPTVALPNSRRSPQSDLRPPQMAPMPGMYPAVNMMLSAPTRPVHPRHPNSTYKYARPSR